MSAETSPERDALAAKLDRVLEQLNDAGDVLRKVQREERATGDIVGKLGEQARRLRLAMWALDGRDEGASAAGKANTANHERSMELRRVDR